MDRTVVAEQDVEIATEFERVHADSLRVLPRLLADLGGDPDALLQRAGIESSSFSKRGSSPGYRALASLLELAAAELRGGRTPRRGGMVR